ncbi:uncharacterized protein AKAW2_61270A [Aspergillus luchuensis]|uniref:Uncharacterized protein n=1 Tax=Aspergillus kawachii TaxID=1069201 RepID=A0A7R7WHM7_ASPKA|nr:uncharacterized protein AKAW2_61270A [Aspergillus luchuensis]BCS03006.1 hypothetical protein AKAW2_61270A [Aspergillus luchuensis]BCS14655.1 hypothetical protein ALUC_61211A [Aspergillus luchuensis]GAA87782.1 hypothetical protein AKAW_05896 [Aspergillus luchuensis IFO 4308]
MEACMGGGGTWSAPPLPGGFPGESPDAPRACDRSKRRLSEDPSNVTMNIVAQYTAQTTYPVNPFAPVYYSPQAFFQPRYAQLDTPNEKGRGGGGMRYAIASHTPRLTESFGGNATFQIVVQRALV